ncbi:hypothetical protein BGP77_10750 [Saccharospirillum sp. MSK14-1]|nr:hypothetical protein BGP77_10750 [Saccharospirillum sp. MSK14-1]
MNPHRFCAAVDDASMLKKIVLILVVAFWAGQAHAERNDFVFNVGVGYGLNNQSVSSWEVESRPASSSDGLVGRVKVGFMPTPVDAMFGFGQVSELNYSSQQSNIESATLTLTGVGFSHYLNADVGSPYFTVAVALGKYRSNGGSEALDNRGHAFLLETGYEVFKHLQVSSTFMMARMADASFYYSDDYLDVSTTSMTVNIEFKL